MLCLSHVKALEILNLVLQAWHTLCNCNRHTDIFFGCPPHWDQQRRQGLPQRRLTDVISRSPNGSAQARRKLAVAGSLAGFALLLCLRECAQLLHDHGHCHRL